MLTGIIILSVLSSAPIVAPDDVPAASPVYAGIAVGDTNVAPVITEPAPADDAAPAGTPLVSINTDVLDMSWTGAMDLADPVLRPSGIVLPFLDAYPIDNLEVKLRLLNVRF